MEVTTCVIPEYKNEALGVTCPGIEFQKIIYEEELQKLNPVLQEAFFPKLNEAVNYLEGMKLSTDKLVPITIVYDFMSLIGNIYTQEKNELLLLICLNLLIRLALNGNIDAMYGITTLTYVPAKEDISKILNIEGIDNLDYCQMVENLLQKLMEFESKDSFIRVIREIRGEKDNWFEHMSPIKRVRSNSELGFEIKKQKL